jgi:hypothetical protein
VLAGSPTRFEFALLDPQVAREFWVIARRLSVKRSALCTLEARTKPTPPDVAEYPETGKIGVALEGAEWEFHRRDDAAPHAGPE